MKENIREKILDYLHRHNTLTLATAKDNKAYAAALFYVNDEFTLYFLSKPDSRHCRNIAINPEVAITINADYSDWRKIQGIQMEGHALAVNKTGEKARFMANYIKKYPFISEFYSIPRLKKTLLEARIYKIVPKTIRFIDNSGGYFDRQKITL